MDIPDGPVNGSGSSFREVCSARSHPSASWAAASNLVGLIYDATVDASRWQTLLDAYVRAVGGRRGCLVLNSGNQNGMALVRWSNWPDGDARLYVERYMADDLYRSAKLAQPDSAIRAIDLTYRAGFSQSTADRRFCESQDIRYQVSGVFSGSAETSSMIVAVRGEQEGRFTEPAFAILRELLPHLRRAALLCGELVPLRLRLAALTVHLDRYPSPLLLTDARGRVIYANAAAVETTGRKDGLAITSGQLSLICPADQAAFVKKLAQVAARQNPAICRLEIKRASHKSPYLLLLLPASCSGVLPRGFVQSAVSILIVDREARPELDPAILRELFLLTPAEARVTGKLAAGWNVEEIAQQIDVSPETVRTHVRRILSKTATVRQGELVSLVLRAAPFRCF